MQPTRTCASRWQPHLATAVRPDATRRPSPSPTQPRARHEARAHFAGLVDTLADRQAAIANTATLHAEPPRSSQSLALTAPTCDRIPRRGSARHHTHESAELDAHPDIGNLPLRQRNRRAQPHRDSDDAH